MALLRFTDEDCWELAHIYVNEAPGNQRAAYRLFLDRRNIVQAESSMANAWKVYHKPKVMEYVEELRAENREKYAEIRDNNIATLNEIATNPASKNQERVQAVKELNTMFGYNQANVNVNANQSIELVIEE